jgi:ABC-2 type transport system ATP-binding protein
MIDCRDVVKRYKKFLAVDRVSLQVSSGICALLGPNGAGKSTLLGLLTGLIAPDEGTVSIAGLDLAQHPSQVKQKIGVLPESLGLFDALTVAEHLELIGPIYGVAKDETGQRSDALLRLFGIEYARQTFARQCSYGTRKKIALAMALLPNPRVLFLDEPLEGIDPSSVQTIQHLLSRIAQRGVTILLTSHVLSTIEQLTSQIVVIQNGKIAWRSSGDSPPQSLHQQYFDLVEEPLKEDLPWLGY